MGRSVGCCLHGIQYGSSLGSLGFNIGMTVNLHSRQSNKKPANGRVSRRACSSGPSSVLNTESMGASIVDKAYSCILR